MICNLQTPYYYICIIYLFSLDVFHSLYYMNELSPIMCFQNEALFLNVFWNAFLSSNQGLEISSFLDMKLKLNCQFNSKMVMELNMNNHHYHLS